MLDGLIVSTSGRNRFDSGWVLVSLGNFWSSSCRVIVLDQTFPALVNSSMEWLSPKIHIQMAIWGNYSQLGVITYSGLMVRSV